MPQVSGVVGICTFSIIPGILAIVFRGIVLHKKQGVKGFSVAGIVLVLCPLFPMLLWLFLFRHLRLQWFRFLAECLFTELNEGEHSPVFLSRNYSPLYLNSYYHSFSVYQLIIFTH